MSERSLIANLLLFIADEYPDKLDKVAMLVCDEWKESEHPRDKDGKFAETNSGKSGEFMTAKNETGMHPVPGKLISEEELKQFTDKMQSLGVEIKGFEEYRGDIEFLDTVYKEMSKIKSLYPEELKDIPLCYTKIMDFDNPLLEDEETFGMYDNNTQSIHLNKVVFDDYNFAKNSHADAVEKGFFPKGTSLIATLWHEVGHRYGYYHKVKYKEIIKRIYYAKNAPIWGNKKMWKAFLTTNLSEYSSKETYTTHLETLAEAFSEYYNSSEPRWLCKEIMRKVGAIT